MESFFKRVVERKGRDEDKRYFLRFGKGDYKRRFLIGYQKGSRLKVKGSYEWANEFVRFVREIGADKFSGKVLMKEKINGLVGRKKAGVFVYEIEEEGIEKFGNAYYLLLDADCNDIVLKTKKALPKPGQAEDKIDNGFCTMDLDLKHWANVKEAFFWDIEDGKKGEVENEIIVEGIEMPKGVSDPVKIRELSKRIGKIKRKSIVDGKENVIEYKLEV